jgi:HSP20 family protein
MLARWYDIDKELASMNEFRRFFDRFFGDSSFDQEWRGVSSLTGTWPRANLFDTGGQLTAFIQVPGLKIEDLQVEVHGDVLTVSGERKSEAPEGYRVHRSERGARKFSRSFGLPCRVNPEKTQAKLVNGVLTINMDKHPESQPKQISVTGG